MSGSLNPAEVTAVLVTRGDVDLQPIIESLPYGEVVIWNNRLRPRDEKVWGRYLALDEADSSVIYFQDDDCIVPPETHRLLLDGYAPGHVTGNIAQLPDVERRLRLYHDTTLLGWGCLFDRWLPSKAFARYLHHYPIDDEFRYGLGAEIVFPMLTPSRTVTGPIEWLIEDGAEVQHRDNRMWRQPDFYRDLDFWLGRARLVRDLIPELRVTAAPPRLG